MPTGYTSPIYDGKDITFEQFILDCSREFGALARFRDQSLEEIPNEIKPDDYHLKKLHETQEKLNEFKSKSKEELEKAYLEEYEKDLEYDNKRRSEIRLLEQRYSDMLMKVIKWNPSKEYDDLKDFAISQLRKSISADCYIEPFRFPNKEFWIENRKQSLEYYIKYHKDSYDKEVEYAKECTKWIQGLKESLNIK